jgi:hypothetical protein
MGQELPGRGDTHGPVQGDLQQPTQATAAGHLSHVKSLLSPEAPPLGQGRRQSPRFAICSPRRDLETQARSRSRSSHRRGARMEPTPRSGSRSHPGLSEGASYRRERWFTRRPPMAPQSTPITQKRNLDPFPSASSTGNWVLKGSGVFRHIVPFFEEVADSAGAEAARDSRSLCHPGPGFDKQRRSCLPNQDARGI